MKPITEFIQLELYPFTLFVSIGQTDKAFNKILFPKYGQINSKNLEALEDITYCSDGGAAIFSGGNVVLRIRKHVTEPDDHASLQDTDDIPF